MNNSKTLVRGAAEKEIVQIFADVTHFPIEILDLDANLEYDLGIDSIKMMEIFVVLHSTYQLPDYENFRIPREALTSIGSIIKFLEPYMERLHAGVAAPDDNTPIARLKQKLDSRQEIDNLLFNTDIPEATGKFEEAFINEFMQHISVLLNIPLPLLRPDDLLETDLSLDEHRLKQLLKDLDTKYGLNRSLCGQASTTFRTLRAIAHAIAVLQSKARAKNSAVVSSETQPSQGRLLEHKICFISSSGQELGEEIASYLAGQGATVIINSFHSHENGIETENEISKKGGKVHHIWGAMADPSHIDSIFDEIENTYGGIDFFIANAGNGTLAKLEDISTDTWNKAFMTDVIGMQQASVRAMKMMRRRGGGKIITLSTPAAHSYTEFYGCMAALKSAVEALTRYMAVEFAPYNIQVNCVSLGPVPGGRINQLPESDRLEKECVQKIPNGRLVKPEEVAHFIGYLLSEPAKMITGSVTVIDGVFPA